MKTLSAKSATARLRLARSAVNAPNLVSEALSDSDAERAEAPLPPESVPAIKRKYQEQHFPSPQSHNCFFGCDCRFGSLDVVHGRLEHQEKLYRRAERAKKHAESQRDRALVRLSESMGLYDQEFKDPPQGL